MADGSSGKLYTQEELNAAVLEGNAYLATNLHEAFTADDIEEAVALLNLKEHEVPVGQFREWNGNTSVDAAALLRKLSGPISLDEVRAVVVLLTHAAADAVQQREDYERSVAAGVGQ